MYSVGSLSSIISFITQCHAGINTNEIEFQTAIYSTLYATVYCIVHTVLYYAFRMEKLAEFQEYQHRRSHRRIDRHAPAPTPAETPLHLNLRIQSQPNLLVQQYLPLQPSMLAAAGQCPSQPCVSISPPPYQQHAHAAHSQLNVSYTHVAHAHSHALGAAARNAHGIANVNLSIESGLSVDQRSPNSNSDQRSATLSLTAQSPTASHPERDDPASELDERRPRDSVELRKETLSLFQQSAPRPQPALRLNNTHDSNNSSE